MSARRGPPAAVLARLAALAQVRADQATARLAETAQSRARLRAAIDGLGRGEDPLAPPPLPDAARPESAPAPEGAALSPLLVRARIAHQAWLDRRRAELLARLARVEADWLRLRPPAATAFGRAEALRDLAREAADAARRRRLERGP